MNAHPRTFRAQLTESQWEEISNVARALQAHGYTHEQVLEQIVFHGLRAMRALADWHATQPSPPR